MLLPRRVLLTVATREAAAADITLAVAILRCCFVWSCGACLYWKNEKMLFFLVKTVYETTATTTTTRCEMNVGWLMCVGGMRR